MWATFCNFLFGEPVRNNLPERVLLSIRELQYASEKLIGSAQLILILVLGGLWMAAPKPPMVSDFQQIPWFLGAYLCFTLLRLICAGKHWLADWFLYLSILIDISLLMALIWSFHHQYLQPPSFYMKAPTLLYVFILIALRALRFEIKFVLATGGAAAIGWSILLFYALADNTGMSVITRDYIVYLTSNRILIGAEVDKIVAILMVTVILSLAVERARRAIYRATTEAEAAADLSRFVSREVAEHITSANRKIQPGDGESRNATVVFTDIEGFSSISENMSASQLAETLNDYFTAMDDAISQQGGVVTLFEGDLMLITFNAVTDDPRHAANALDTALAIQQITSTQRFGPLECILPTRIGINTGDIAIGAVGTKDRLVFTVHGDAVNIAARLEQLNKEHGTYILATADTIESAGAGYDARHVTDCVVKGRITSTKVFTLTPRTDN